MELLPRAISKPVSTQHDLTELFYFLGHFVSGLYYDQQHVIFYLSPSEQAAQPAWPPNCFNFSACG